MKRLILLLALLFSVSSSFISCREPEEDADEMEMEEMGDEVEDETEDIEEELEE